jgi:enoyl-CoA hydratase/carnithine racemase
VQRLQPRSEIGHAAARVSAAWPARSRQGQRPKRAGHRRVRSAPLSASLEILVEGRVWGAQEALAKGVLTRVVADDSLEQEAYATARRIADGAPLVARWHKQFVRRLTPQPAVLTQDEIEENFAYFNTEDYRIGYEAFISKKKPRFVGR